MGAWLPSLLWIDAISLLCVFVPALFASSTAAQSVTLLPSAASDTFPACALTCQTLEQAQGSCVPPAAPVTNKATYVSCFCQSTLLTQLRSSPASVCTACSAADAQTLEQWYNNFCATGGDVQTTTTSTSTAATNAAATTTAATHVKSYPSPPSWISTHYQWVIMIIVLAVGLTAIALAGMWLKRRYDAKRPGLYHGDTSTADGTAPPPNAEGVAGVPYPKSEVWGPPQTRSVDFVNMDSAVALAGSKSEFSGTSTPDTRNGPNSSRNSRLSTRLQKVAGPSQEGDIDIHEV
ncbi:hypothetical protein DTO212C5_6857 [Paecilomyces variotii]|nr:hypothetical protein DTO212C5_6857 [Paecilomyces variotii]